MLRESYREGAKVCKRTLANLSGLAAFQIASIRATLRGEALCSVAQTFEITRSLAHGHVQAVQLAMQRLGLASLLASKPCPERGLVQAMVASRILCPATKLATTRLWHASCIDDGDLTPWPLWMPWNGWFRHPDIHLLWQSTG